MLSGLVNNTQRSSQLGYAVCGAQCQNGDLFHHRCRVLALDPVGMMSTGMGVMVRFIIFFGDIGNATTGKNRH
jgi:hypothetical protein